MGDDAGVGDAKRTSGLHVGKDARRQFGRTGWPLRADN